MKKRLVLTVGNEMMGDDAAGPLLAQMMLSCPVQQWDFIDGGSAPENCIFKIREIAPEQVLMVDAADMELDAGEIRLIGRNQIDSLFLMTTHALPLTFLMESIGESVPRVELLGIQPEVVAFGYPVSGRVSDAVERVYEWLKSGSEIVQVAQSIREPEQET